MKRILILSVILLGACFCYAQDIISLNDGSQIESKVLEISTTAVKYKKWENQSGPTYEMPISRINRVQYANGDVDILAKEVKASPATVSPKESNMDMSQKIAQSAKEARETREEVKIVNKHVLFGARAGIGGNFRVGPGDGPWWPDWDYSIRGQMEWFPDLTNGNFICLQLGYLATQNDATVSGGGIDSANLGYLSITPMWGYKNDFLYTKFGLDFNFLVSKDDRYSKDTFNDFVFGPYWELGWAHKCIELGVFVEWLITRQVQNRTSDNCGAGITFGVVF